MQRGSTLLLLSSFLLRSAALAASSASSTLSACSCDCCEVEVQRVDGGAAFVDLATGTERLECVLAESGLAPTSSFRAQNACGALCLRGTQDEVLRAAEVPEMDTQRFCFFECAPDRKLSEGRDPKKGDACRALGQEEAQEVGGDESGNGVPPNEQAEVSSLFLAHRPAAPRASLAVSSQRLAASSSAEARAAAQEAAAEEVERAVAEGRAAGAGDLVLPAPAPAPGPAPGVEPWVSIADPAPENMGRIAEMAEETARTARSAEEDVDKIKQLADKSNIALPTALAAVDDAKNAARKAVAEEKKIRAIRDQLLREGRKEAFTMVPKLLKEITARAHTQIRVENIKEAPARQRLYMQQAKAAGEAAKKRWRDAEKRASEIAGEWAERGDQFAKQAADLTREAEDMQGTADDPMLGKANQLAQVGDYKGAQSLVIRAHKYLDQARDFNAKAEHAWNTAQSIEATLPGYERQAEEDAYHAEAMMDPYAKPPVPLVTVN